MAIAPDASTIPEFDAASAFMKSFGIDENANDTDANELSEAEEEKRKKHHEEEPEDEDAEEPAEDEDDSEEEADDDEDEQDEEDEPKEKPKSKAKIVLEHDADAIVKVKVDGKELELPVKELTRLYGQEASLTRKSQELATQRTNADTTLQKYVAATETLLTRAREEFEPYSKLNFLALSKDPNISAEDLTALQAQAQKAYQNVQFLEGELDGTVKHYQEARHNNLVQEAQKSWQLLSDPKTGIENWGHPLYQEVRNYGLSSGINKQIMDELVDPAAIKLLHKAMLYDRGQKAMKTTKKVDKSPKKIIKSSTQEISNKAKPSKGGTEKAWSKFKTSGTVDDAADVFLSRMQSD